MTAWLTLIGVSEAGVAALPAETRQLIAAATTVLGPARLLQGVEALCGGPTPSPSLPARGRVPDFATGSAAPPPAPPGTSPLVGEAGRGEAGWRDAGGGARAQTTPPLASPEPGSAAPQRSLPLEGRDAGRQGGGCSSPPTPASAQTPPSPALPTRGRVPDFAIGESAAPPLAPPGTSPLAGEAGRGDAEGDAFAPRLSPWTTPLAAMLAQIEAVRGEPTVILATGDPLWFGIGATLLRTIPAAEMRFIPAPSAFQLAAARLGWPLQQVATLSLHGRPVETLHPHVLPGNRIIVLASDRTTASAVAHLLTARGYGNSRLIVLERMGGPDERRTEATAARFDAAAIGDFFTLGIACVARPEAPLLPPLPGLPDTAFANDGQLSKREVRAATLAKLAPYPGARLWDIGAGSGAIGIEWLRAARDATAIAVERDAGRAANIAANARALGVPGLVIVTGEAPAALAGQPVPDAVFLGGDVDNEALFAAAWAALRPGGRLVANAVTLDAEAALYTRQARFGGELTRLEISTLDRIGGARVLRPKLAVTQWLVTKP